MSDDPFRYFRIEARELVTALEKGLIALELGELDEAGERDLMRTAHTLKGAAAVVGCRDVADRAHAMEDELAGQRDVDTLLGLLDQVLEGIRRIDAAPKKQSDSGGAPLPAVGLRDDGPSTAPGPADLSSQRHGTLTVDADALSRALDDIDEGHDVLVELEQLLAELLLAEDEAIRAKVEQGARCVASVRRRLASGAHRLRTQRLVPVSTLFGGLTRGLREACKVAGRDVRLTTEGGDERVDADVLEALRAPLQHLVRNAVDHGIEAPEERTRAGKPTVGSLRVSVQPMQRELAIVFADDGRGLDLRGLQRAAEDPHADAAELAFRHGVTSATTVGTLSGRGVGLSSVRQAVTSLGGRIALDSVPGRGVTVTVSVPVTLTGRDVLLAEAGSHRVAFDLASVVEVLTVAPDALVGDGVPSLETRGGAVSFADLPGILGEGRPHGERWIGVVVREGDRRAALGVDRVVGIAHRVVRPVPVAAGSQPLLMGVVAEQEGYALALRTSSVIDAVHTHGADLAKRSSTARAPRLLVIDDSLTTRMLEQAILESAGFEVVLAVDAESGLEIGRRGGFDMILVDVEMPGMNGFEFVRTWRADPDLPPLPIAMVTTLSSPEHRREGMEAGAQAWFVKTEFEEGAYLETIGRLIG